MITQNKPKTTPLYFKRVGSPHILQYNPGFENNNDFIPLPHDFDLMAYQQHMVETKGKPTKPVEFFCADNIGNKDEIDVAADIVDNMNEFINPMNAIEEIVDDTASEDEDDSYGNDSYNEDENEIIINDDIDDDDTENVNENYTGDQKDTTTISVIEPTRRGRPRKNK